MLAVALAVGCVLVLAASVSVFGQGVAGMLGLGEPASSPPLAARTARAEAISPASADRAEVPDVRGMTLVQAQAMLETVGALVRVSVDYGAAPSAEQRVRAQQPGAGSVVSAGSCVDLSVPPRAGQAKNATPQKEKARTYTVVIDPGHQSTDGPGMEPVGPGASGTVVRASRGGIGKETGVPEYELARQLAASLEDRLTFAGVRVITTRSTNDVDLSSAQRAEVANSAKADLLVEIHLRCEASPTGVRTYYPATNRWTKGTAGASRRAADAVQHGVLAATGAGDAGVVAASDVVSFNWSKVACVRVEVGSIANPVEERLLSSAKYQDRVVDGLANGVTEYLRANR